jgi:perosamine synthetase
MSLHGISHDAWKRYRAEGSWYYEVVAPGFKYNMTDIAAALGLAQLRRADAMRARRQEIAEQYNAAFKGHEFDLPAFGDVRDHSWHLYPLRLPAGANRGAFVDALRAREIGASVHFIPLHLHPFYRDRYGFTPDSFPVSTAEYEREVSLPIYSAMSDAGVDAVISAVTAVIRGASRVLAG